MIYNESKYNTSWKTEKLSGLGVFSRGISKHRPRNDPRLFTGGGYPLVQTGEIKEANLFITSHTQEYGEFGLQQSRLWDAGTLCITIAANIAETAILSYPMCFPDSVVGFQANKAVSSELFMYYVFDYIRTAIQGAATGSAQDNINIDYLTSLEFKIPSKEYQDKIVGIVGSLDRMILKNEQINDNLQQQLRLLYDYWFTQFDFPDENGKPYRSSGGAMVWNSTLKAEIPLGWTVGVLSDCIAKVSTGLNPRDNFKLGNGSIRYITVKNLTMSGVLDFSGCDTIDETAQTLIHRRSDISKGDILFASIPPLGRCYLIEQNPTDWEINESVFSIRPNIEMTTAEFLYSYFTSPAFIKGATSSSTGSVFKGIRINTLLDTKVLIPPYRIASAFSAKVRGLFSMLDKNAAEISTLSGIRDWLLPMLMNGQATISD